MASDRRDEGSVLKVYKTNKKTGVRRETGQWFARLRYTDADGRHREKKRIYATQALAKAGIATLRAEIAVDAARTADGPSERPTYRDLDEFYRREYVHAAKFVGGRKVSGFRQSLKTVRMYLDRAAAHFGDTPLDELGYPELREYKLMLEATPVEYGPRDKVTKRRRRRARSVADVNQHLRKLRRVLNVAVEQRMIAANPFKHGRPLISDAFETERTRVLTRWQEKRLLAACRIRQKFEAENVRLHLMPVIVFAIETGCRAGEIKQVRWSDVDLDGRVVTIRATNTKTQKERLVPVTARCLAVLKHLRNERRQSMGRVLHSPFSTLNSQFVFGSDEWKRAFTTARRIARLTDITFHDLRHTAITRMLEEGLPPAIVMKISGHTQWKTFMRYVNQTPQSMLEIALRRDRAAA